MAAAVASTATSLEGQLFETANRIQAAELEQPIETRPNNIQVTLDRENETISVVFTSPATFSIDGTGKLVASPTPYLP